MSTPEENKWANPNESGFVSRFASNTVAYLNLRLGANLDDRDKDYQQAIVTLENKLGILLLEIEIKRNAKSVGL